MKLKIGVIGTGNMGGALVKGIAGNVSDIRVFDADSSKARRLSEETGAVFCGSSKELTEVCDCIILAVKPQYIGDVLSEIAGCFTREKILVSIAVGITTDYMASFLSPGAKIVRTMPNTPASVGEGMTILCFPPSLTDAEKLEITELFSYVGKTCELPETLMCEVTALTGSSPAYVFMFIEAMADAAVLSGIPRNLAYDLAAQSVLGSAKMALLSGMHPGVLKDQVCSPAGTTIEAVAALEEYGLRNAVIKAMDACTKRAKEIANAKKSG